MIQAVVFRGNGFYFFLYIFFHIYAFSLRKNDYLCTIFSNNITEIHEKDCN